MDDDSNNTHQRRKGLKSWFKRTDTRRIAEQAPVSSTSSHHVFWPEEYLVPDLPGACIWTYGYNADVFGGFFQANNQNSISHHGRDLAARLGREFDNKVYSGILFLAQGSY
jgi:hypothetical protein